MAKFRAEGFVRFSGWAMGGPLDRSAFHVEFVRGNKFGASMAMDSLLRDGLPHALCIRLPKKVSCYCRQWFYCISCYPFSTLNLTSCSGFSLLLLDFSSLSPFRASFCSSSCLSVGFSDTLRCGWHRHGEGAVRNWNYHEE